MKYIGDFYSLKGDKYTVQIITNNDTGTTREIILGVPPFTTEQDTSNDNIYKPIKYQSATVNIVTSGESDYMFDLYSGEADGTRVTLYKSGTTIWDGFATPVIYQNGYTEIHENLELECIDGLSILQYFKYSASPKKVLSFIEIINKILVRSKVYTNLYVSNNVYRTNNIPILNDLYISEQNFFGEKDSDETDDDVAMSCNEVLEHICTYLGLVCVADGSSVYLLDLDAIRANRNTYTQYTIGSTAYTTVTLSNTLAIDGEKYRGGNNTISLDNVYNKVSVKDSFYTFDSVIPNLYDTATNITKSTDSDLANSHSIEDGMYGEVVSGSDGNMEILIDRVYDPEDEEYTDCNVVAVKYYKNDNYNFQCPSSLNYTDTKTMNGAVIAKFFVKKLENTYLDSWIDFIIGRSTLDSHTLDDWMAANGISNFNWSNYVCLFNPLKQLNQPWVTTKESELPALFGGENSYLIIKGSYCFHYIHEDPYPIPQDEIDIAQGRYAMDAGQTYLKCKLQWGNLYWNGSGWTSTNSTFNIPYIREDASCGERRSDGTMFKDLDFLNTVNWRIGTNQKGYLIPTPNDYAMNGLPKITIYSPHTPNYHSCKSGDDEGEHYDHNRVFLKNFDVVAFVGDPTFSEMNDSDTVYTNVIDNNHVQEFDEIEFKICTNDNKNPNYSSVGYKENGVYHFITSLTNNAMSLNQTAEEMLVNRLCNQYKTPRIRLKLQLENNILPYTLLSDKWVGVSKRFIVDSQSIDYSNDITNITIVEKG